MFFVCHPKILRRHCLQFLLGVKMARRETENNAYAKFWGDKRKTLWYVMVFSGVVNSSTGLPSALIEYWFNLFTKPCWVINRCPAICSPSKLFIYFACGYMVKPIFGKFSRTSGDTMITLNLTCIKLLVIHKYKTVIEFFHCRKVEGWLRN